ncbi:MAG: replication-associated recombination protein A [Gemmatimonadota bacterium]
MPVRKSRPDQRDASLFAQAADSARPLAARMRPATLDEFAGQRHLVGPGRPLREAVERGSLGSVIFWGPPGTGKTTLGHLIAGSSDRAFVPFSAVTEGVPRLREIIADARERLDAGGRRTVLFVDELHRLASNQQDALLPAVENGIVTMIGATTENPSFAVNGALLSRSRVFVLEALSAADVAEVLQRALRDDVRGLGTLGLRIDDDALRAIAEEADGDARRALTVLEAASDHVGPGGAITMEVAREAMQLRFAHHDKAGESHFNILSAFHKSLRGSDPQGALYWMARLIDGGEDPLVIFRRSIAMSAEDIGLADPNALKLAVAARDAYLMLGPPEGYLPLAEMVIYLATAPKSNSSYRALQAALEAARNSPAAPVPLHIRNAPTGLMKELGYGAGYQYAHTVPDAYIPQEYLPDSLAGSRFYEPGPFGFEKDIAKRLAWWAELRERDQPSGAKPPDDGQSVTEERSAQPPTGESA